MIKTVSFTPPRAARATARAGGKASSATARAQLARANETAPVVSKRAETQPARTQPATSPAPTEPVARRRSARTSATTPDAAPRSADAVEVAATTKRAAPAAKTATKKGARQTNLSAPVEVEAPQSATAPVADAALVAPKAKRSRVPKDLALQYGAAPETERVERVVEKPVARKRRTRAEKEARSQMLRPDDDVLQRLQQANAIQTQKPARRGRGWEFECGCCGRISRFQTPGALCPCGAIAVRE